MAKADINCKPGAPFFKTILVNVLMGLVVSVLMLLVLCLLVNTGLVPEGFIFPLAALSAGVGALIAAMNAAAKLKTRRLASGMLSGVLFFVILLLLSLLSPAGMPDMKSALVILASVLLGSFFGSVLSGNVKQKRRR